jgi:hypothetical protein
MPKAFIYWNFHKKVFSVKFKGRVIAHATHILAEDAEFRVSEAGRQRVLTEGCKNVHAYIVCDLAKLHCASAHTNLSCTRLYWSSYSDTLVNRVRDYGYRVRYNPYESGSFIVENGYGRIKSAQLVYGFSNPGCNSAGLRAIIKQLY